MALAASSHSATAADLAALINAVAPKRFLRDPFGLVSGYRAYLVYTHLAAKSDSELAALGVGRDTLAQTAMKVVLDGRNAG